MPLASLVISLAGVGLAAVSLNTTQRMPSTPAATIYIWSLFSALCILGSSATLFPHICLRSDRRPEELDPSRISNLFGIRVVHGHHPRCGEFQGHELLVNDKTFCAGCIGLLLGASTALILSTLHFFSGFTYPWATSFVGLGCVVLGLLHIPLLRTSILILRTAFNLALVAGFALLLVGVDEIGSLELDLIAIGLCVFWMFTRIQLSSWDHERICRGCGYRCVERGSMVLSLRQDAGDDEEAEEDDNEGPEPIPRGPPDEAFQKRDDTRQDDEDA